MKSFIRKLQTLTFRQLFNYLRKVECLFEYQSADISSQSIKNLKAFFNDYRYSEENFKSTFYYWAEFFERNVGKLYGQNSNSGTFSFVYIFIKCLKPQYEKVLFKQNMIRTFTQLRKKTPSKNKLTFETHHSDIEHLQMELNNLNIKNSQHITDHIIRPLQHSKTQAVIKWKFVQNQIAEEDETPKEVHKKIQRTKYIPFNKKHTLVESRQYLRNMGNGSNSLKNMNLGPITIPKDGFKMKGSELNKDKQVTSMTKRDKQKITIRLKGIIDIINNNEISTQNISQIVSIIDQLTQKIKPI